MLPGLTPANAAPSAYGLAFVNAHKATHGHPGPLFLFRTSCHVSESMKDLTHLKVLPDPDHRDRQKRHPTTIMLCKSQSSQAAMRPREHKVFMEEAYNAGDHQRWDSSRQKWGGQAPADPIMSPCQKCPGNEGQRESTAWDLGDVKGLGEIVRLSSESSTRPPWPLHAS